MDEMDQLSMKTLPYYQTKKYQVKRVYILNEKL